MTVKACNSRQKPTAEATDTLRFEHTVSDENGDIVVQSLTLNGATAQDGVQHDLNPAFEAKTIADHLVGNIPPTSTETTTQQASPASDIDQTTNNKDLASSKVTVTNVQVVGGCKDFVTKDILKLEVTFSKAVTTQENPGLEVRFGNLQKVFPFELDAEQPEEAHKLVFSKKITGPNHCETDITVIELLNAYTRPFQNKEGQKYNKSFAGEFHGEDGAEVVTTFDPYIFNGCRVNPTVITKIYAEDSTETLNSGDTLEINVDFSTEVKVATGETPDQVPMLNLLVDGKTVMAELFPLQQQGKTLNFTYSVVEGIQTNQVSVQSIDMNNGYIQDVRHLQTIDLSDFKVTTLTGILIDSGVATDSVVTEGTHLPDTGPVKVIDIEPTAEARQFTHGQEITLAVTTSAPVAFHPEGDLKPVLTLMVNGKPIEAQLKEQPGYSQTQSFTFTVEKGQPVTDQVTPRQLSNQGLLKTASGTPLEASIDSQPIPMFIDAEYPQFVTSPDVQVYEGNQLLVHGKGEDTQMLFMAPDNLKSASLSIYGEGTWSDFSLRDVPFVKAGTEGMSLYSFPLIVGPVHNGFSLLAQFRIETAEGTQSSVYKVGFGLPCHHYSFDTPWTADKASIQSLAYPRAGSKPEVVGDVVQTNSPFSLGHALEFKGGHLKLGSMTPELSGSFTFCAWLKATAPDDSSRNPALIGTDGEGGISLISVNPDGYAAFMRDGQQVQTTVQITGDEPVHVCLVNTQVPASDSQADPRSESQFFINGQPDTPEATSFINFSDEESLTAEVNVIGGVSSKGQVVPWLGTLGETKLYMNALSESEIANLYTKTTVITLDDPSDYQPLGMVATMQSKQLAGKENVWFKFTNATTLEKDSDGDETPVDVMEGVIKCKYVDDTGQPAEKGFDLETAHQLGSTKLTDLSQLQCQIDSSYDSVTMLVDSDKSDLLDSTTPDVRLLMSHDLLRCPLSNCVKFNSGSQLAGNGPLDANGEKNWFGAKAGDSVTQVGSEDVVILDELPNIRELINAEDTETGAALNKLFENGMGKVHTISVPSTGDTEAASGSRSNEPLLSVETLALKPFYAALDSEIYTIHPDHLA